MYFTYKVTEAYFHQRPCPFIRKSTQIDNLHVENVQERHFLEIKKSNAKNHTGLGGEALGYYS